MVLQAARRGTLGRRAANKRLYDELAQLEELMRHTAATALQASARGRAARATMPALRQQQQDARLAVEESARREEQQVAQEARAWDPS